MAEKLLEIKDLHAGVEGKEILKGLNLSIDKGEVHVILGPNGSGKSTLMNIIMGHPKYEVTAGSMRFEAADLQAMKTFERARAGIFLSFQTPEEIPGITVENMLRTAKQAMTGAPVKILAFRKKLKAMMAELKMDPAYAERYMNVGFSGGEKKRNEVFQMAVLQPRFAVLDETDSGLDIDALKIVAKGVNAMRSPVRGFLEITHYQRLLNYIVPDKVHVMLDGRICRTGGKELALELEDQGYAGDHLETAEV